MSRKRNYCFTINNPGELQFQEEDLETYKIKYIAYSLEEGENGTPHFQGFVLFINPRTLLGVKRLAFFNRAHLEIMNGTFQQNLTYITKAPLSFHEFGQRPEAQGKRNDLEEVKNKIMSEGLTYDDCLLEYPMICARYPKYVRQIVALRNKKKAREARTKNKRKRVYVLWGKPGTGKTRFVYDHHPIEDIYTLTFGDGSSNSLWFDDYQGEKILLLDDFYGNIKYNYLLRLLDNYPMRVQEKGSFNYLNFKYIYITSNKRPSKWYDRAKIPDQGALVRRIGGIVHLKKSSQKSGGSSITPPLLCTSKTLSELNDFLKDEKNED